jgi:hypothetical protein
MRSRPVPVTVAAILLALCSLLSLPGPLLPGSEGVPEVVLYSGIVLGIVGLVAAVGLWMLKKWSLWLTIVVSVLNILSAAPGLAFAPNAPLQVAATVTLVVFALIIVLVVGLPSSRRALAASLWVSERTLALGSSVNKGNGAAR